MSPPAATQRILEARTSSSAAACASMDKAMAATSVGCNFSHTPSEANTSALPGSRVRPAVIVGSEVTPTDLACV